MKLKLASIIAVSILVAAGIGFAIGNPEAVGALAENLTGAADRRSYGASTYQLTLGSAAITLRSIAGCTVSADVATVDLGPDAMQKKHVQSIVVEPCVLSVPGSSTPALTTWIAESMTGAPKASTMSIITFGADGKATEKRELRDARLTAVTFPRLDAASKDPVVLLLEVTPAEIRVAKGAGETAKPAEGKDRTWSASAFRLELNGLDMSRVSVVDEFTIRNVIPDNGFGAIPEQMPGAALVVPDLELKFPAGQTADAVASWYDSFIVQQQNGDDREKTGKLTFLDGGLRNDLGSIELGGVGIRRYAMEPTNNTNTKSPLMRAELYVETMRLKAGS